jgi:hypothetical protein
MATPENKSKPDSNPITKYIFFLIVFSISFGFIKTKSVEIFGIGLFFAINILFCVFIGKELSNQQSDNNNTTERLLRFGSLIVAVAFSFVSTIMMIMTFVTLQSKFAEHNSEIMWSPSDRKKLNTTEILFITVTTFIGVTALYVFNSADDVQTMTYTIFNGILNSNAANWLRVLFPIAIIALGSALYGRLQMKPLEVSKFPTNKICDVNSNVEIRSFKNTFIKTYWILFAFVIVILARPFIEANFNLFGSGIYPSKMFGFTNDRSFIFGQNPTISVLYLLNLILIGTFIGLIVMGTKSPNILAALLSTFFIIWAIDSLVVWIQSESYSSFELFFSILLSPFVLLVNNKLLFNNKYDTQNNDFLKFLFSPAMRWDVMYLLAKYGLGLAGLIYAAFSIKYFREIPKDNDCLYTSTHIRQLYIAFIFFLIVFYTFNTFSASTLTNLTTGIMRYLVPPALLGTSSYLIFITNYFVKMAPQIIIE